MLGAFIGENADSAELICPEVGSEPAPTDVNRPELRLLDARNTLLDAQLKQLNARNRRPSVCSYREPTANRD